MAKNRIKGITIEIGGDTKQLQDSLKAANNTIKATQDGLKDVNNLLKMDPGNVELLKQKQPRDHLCTVRWSVPDQPPDQCVHSPLISACQSLITA